MSNVRIVLNGILAYLNQPLLIFPQLGDLESQFCKLIAITANVCGPVGAFVNTPRSGRVRRAGRRLGDRENLRGHAEVAQLGIVAANQLRAIGLGAENLVHVGDVLAADRDRVGCILAFSRGLVAVEGQGRFILRPCRFCGGE